MPLYSQLDEVVVQTVNELLRLFWFSPCYSLYSGGASVRTSITLDDEVFRELLEITHETNRTRAVQIAVERFVRDTKLERLRKLKGKVKILSNDEVEAEELDELERQSD